MPGSGEGGGGYRELFSTYNTTELVRITRASGLGGDHTCSKEELIEILNKNLEVIEESYRDTLGAEGFGADPLRNNVNDIRRKLLKFMEKRWRIERYRFSCPAKEDPEGCYLCSDGQLWACYLFGNNKKIIEEIADE